MEIVDTLVNGGAVGIAILLIFMGNQKDKMFNKTLNNHFNHHTEAFNRTTEVLARMEKLLDIKLK